MVGLQTAQRSAAAPGSGVIFAIALFKLLKGILLVVVGVGALKLLHRDVAATISHWVELLRIDPDNRVIHGLLSRALAVSPKQLKAASIGTFLYSTVFFTEGVGLLLRKRWAEYFTIVSTGGLIPLELYEIHLHVTVAKILVLLVNLAIVVYLVERVRSPDKGGA